MRGRGTAATTSLRASPPPPWPCRAGTSQTPSTTSTELDGDRLPATEIGGYQLAATEIDEDRGRSTAIVWETRIDRVARGSAGPAATAAIGRVPPPGPHRDGTRRTEAERGHGTERGHAGTEHGRTGVLSTGSRPWRRERLGSRLYE